MAVPLQAGVVEQMGIRRSTDKVDAVSGAHTFFGIVCLCELRPVFWQCSYMLVDVNIYLEYARVQHLGDN